MQTEAAECAVFPARVTILTGYYGSGKTEVALHVARSLAGEAEGVRLVDLDFLKPVFRAREHRPALARAGVRLVAPEGELAAAEVPVMPCVSALLGGPPHERVIIDLAGDGGGARAIAQFAPLLARNPHELIMVVNPMRPFARTAERIERAVRELEQVTRLRVAALLANGNLGAQTTPAVVLDGLEIARVAAGVLALPLRAVVIPEFLRGRMDPLGIAEPCLWLRRRVLLPWESNAATP
jgi:hypothetical protein